MKPLSENAIRLLGEAGQSGDGPGRLHRAWTGGELDNDDLPALISQVWTHTDNAEQTIGTVAWLAMFRAAGPIVVPTTRSLPSEPLLVYRGTAESRKGGMAWTWDIERARWFRCRCEHFGEVAGVYRTSITPAAVLAMFDTRGEREFVVDPSLLGVIERIE